MILEDWRVGQYGPDRNQDHLFFLFSRNKPIKVISVKVVSIVMGSQFICDIASADGVKIRLAA